MSEFNSLSDEDDDQDGGGSSSSNKTLESGHEQVESDDSSWRRTHRRHSGHKESRPMSEVIVNEKPPTVRLRSLSQLPSMRENRSSADVYMIEGGGGSRARYSLSPQRQQQQQQQHHHQGHYQPGYANIDPACYSNSQLYSSTASLSHLQLGASNFGNYHQMLPAGPMGNYSPQAALAAAVRSNYMSSMCRGSGPSAPGAAGGCDHCPPPAPPYHPVGPCHSMFDPRLTCWDYGPANYMPAFLSSGPSSPFGTLRKVVIDRFTSPRSI